MTTIHRFNNLFDAVRFLTDSFQMTNQEATHFVWDHQSMIGTDRGIWIDVKSLIGLTKND
jgi:hypothetical protein